MRISKPSTHASCRVSHTRSAIRHHALGLLVLLTLPLALGCSDSVPTAVEAHAAPAADEAVAAAKGGPAHTGVLARATFPNDQVCGISVTTEVFQTGAAWEVLPGGLPPKQTGNLRVTFTADNGQSVQLHAAGQATREITEWIDEEAGTFSGRETVVGLARTIKPPHGPAFYRDVGRIVIGYPLIQLLDDEGFIILEPPVILEISGPHPEAESNFTLFCAAVTEALS